MLELDNSKASSLAAKISALETENDSLRMQRGGSSADGAQLNEERRKNRMLETECEVCWVGPCAPHSLCRT